MTGVLKNDVFVNCPFDEDFRECFGAIVFTVMAAGYRVRCALEESNSGEIRLEKLYRLIEEADLSIHDLSRTESGVLGLPRFNMPFELGVTMGAQHFGGRRQKRKRALIAVREPYQMPKYLSDLGGNDPISHNGQADVLVGEIRKFLHVAPDGQVLPGGKYYKDKFREFKTALPAIAQQSGFEPDEADPLSNYKV